MKQTGTVALKADDTIEAEARPGKSRLLLGLLSGASIVVLDFFIVLACLPAIEQVLGATRAQLQLILAAYAVANASLLVVGGRLGDALGRKRVMQTGVAAFAVSSLACGLATSPWSLIVFRAAQGLSGAMVQPQVLGLLTVNFTSQERPRVFGLYAAALGCAGIAAQLLGGLFVGFLPADVGWRACFIASVPLCLMAMVLSRGARDGEHGPSRKIDLVGAALLGLALACVCTFLTMGREQGWPTWAFAVLTVGVCAGLGLWRWQAAGYRDGGERIIPQGILSHNGFWVSLLTIFGFYSGVASLYFVLALELRMRNGYSAVQVGLFFGWLAAFFVATSTMKRVKALIGDRWAEIGLACLLAGHVAMLLAGGDVAASQVFGFVVSCALQGAGIGCLMGPLMAVALSKAPPQQASVAGGIASSMQQIGNSLGIAAIGFAYFGGATSASTSLAGAVAYLVFVVVAVGVLVTRPKVA